MNARSPARILEVTSYPPPRSGWGIRVEFVKKRLERDGHRCVVINTGTSRLIPSPEYETVESGRDFVRKVWTFSRQGFVVHGHANGDAVKGILLALAAGFINALHGRRCVLTFHAGAIQRFFPQNRGPLLVPLFWLLFVMPKRIICNNRAVAERIQSYGVSASKIDVIPAFCRDYLEFTQKALPPHVEAFFSRYSSVVFAYLRMRSLFYPVVMIDGLARLVASRPDVGLVICGGMSHGEESLRQEVQAAIEKHRLQDHVCFVEDLDHDEFLTALQRSALYLRTPITDGVASSVLEALALGIPVVACENGTRPAGVITYTATEPDELAAAVERVLADRAGVVASLQTVDLPDTLTDEVNVLTS
jgi:glycosyltransferase involved in cell wall biosynthesis